MSDAIAPSHIKIFSRWSDRVAYETTTAPSREAAILEALKSGTNLRDADLSGANLSGTDLRDADLRDADLRDADLSGANLRDADLRGTNLSGTNLSGTDLSGANLRGTDLSGTDLSGANLSGTDLRGTDLRDADLRDADLSVIRADFYSVLDNAAPEVPGLLAALEAGKINGLVYDGDCACLVGTIANVRGCKVRDLTGSLAPDSGRPAERWFLAITIGHKPSNCQVSAITAEWIREWQAKQPAQA